MNTKIPNSLLRANPKVMITENKTFTVHQTDPSADYTDLATACYDVYNKYYPKAVAGGMTAGGITVEIKCLSGYVMTSPLQIANGIDMGFINITSVDDDVKVDPTNSEARFWISAYTCCRLPIIQTLFDLESKFNSLSQTVRGIDVRYQSKLVVYNRTLGSDRTSGFINCSGSALHAEGDSTVLALYTKWGSTSATENSVRSRIGSQIILMTSESTVGGSGYGYFVDYGGIIQIRNSTGFFGTVSQTVNTLTSDGIIFQST